MHLKGIFFSSYFHFFLINERKRKRDEKDFDYRILRGWQSPVITKIILIGAPDPNWMTTEMKK